MRAALFLIAVVLSGCAWRPLHVPADPVTDGASPDTAGPPRAPKDHRTTGATCTTDGGPGAHDDCASDSDCPAGVPCGCQSIAWGIGTVNRCLSTSTCAVDSDCGPGGFCSPSLVNTRCVCLSPALCDPGTHCYAGNMEVPCACGDACGHGYFCHTKDDACLDDGDCGNGEQCNWDRVNQRWACSGCLLVPGLN